MSRARQNFYFFVPFLLHFCFLRLHRFDQTYEKRRKTSSMGIRLRESRTFVLILFQRLRMLLGPRSFEGTVNPDFVL